MTWIEVRNNNNQAMVASEPFLFYRREVVEKRHIQPQLLAETLIQAYFRSVISRNQIGVYAKIGIPDSESNNFLQSSSLQIFDIGLHQYAYFEIQGFWDNNRPRQDLVTKSLSMLMSNDHSRAIDIRGFHLSRPLVTNLQEVPLVGNP